MKGINMIKIIAKILVKDDAIEQFQKEAGELIEKSRAEEGNVSYTLNQNVDDPCEHVFMEIWKDDEAIQKHNASEHFTGIFPKLAALAKEDPVVDLYKEI